VINQLILLSYKVLSIKMKASQWRRRETRRSQNSQTQISWINSWKAFTHMLRRRIF